MYTYISMQIYICIPIIYVYGAEAVIIDTDILAMCTIDINYIHT